MPYSSLEQFKAYASNRGLKAPDDDAECLRLLVLANDWLESKQYKGERITPDQMAAWPRRFVSVDGYFLSDTEVPERIVNAECQLAMDYMNLDLLPTHDGKEVVKKSIAGAMTFDYASTGTRPLPKPEKALSFLRPLLKTGFTIGRA